MRGFYIKERNGETVFVCKYCGHSNDVPVCEYCGNGKEDNKERGNK